LHVGAFGGSSFNSSVGERAAWRPRKGVITQIAFTGGYVGDLREPSVFDRLDRVDEWNYEQLLIGWRLGEHIVESTDFTHEGERDTLRAACTSLPTSRFCQG